MTTGHKWTLLCLRGFQDKEVGKHCIRPMGKYWLSCFWLGLNWTISNPWLDFACHSDCMWHAFRLNTYNALSQQHSTTKCFQVGEVSDWGRGTYFSDGITSKLPLTSINGCLVWLIIWKLVVSPVVNNLYTRHKWIWLRLLQGYITGNFSYRNQKSVSVTLRERR